MGVKLTCLCIPPVSYTHLDVYKRQVMAVPVLSYRCAFRQQPRNKTVNTGLRSGVLIGVKRCSKLDRIINEAIREEFQVFNLNKNLQV